jgi:hypothetical protein
MPYRTSTIAGFGFCMFWMGFLYPRSHPGWIGPIGESEGAVFIQKPTYRYFITFSSDLHSIWRNRLAFLMSFRTSRIEWLGFCMIWLSFVYPRSHSGWIGTIGRFNASSFTAKPAYRYPIPLSPGLHSKRTKRLAFLTPFHISRIGWLVFCMTWLSCVSQSVRVTCLSYPIFWHYRMTCFIYCILFPCYMEFGCTKQALEAKLPKCTQIPCKR